MMNYLICKKLIVVFFSTFSDANIFPEYILPQLVSRKRGRVKCSTVIIMTKIQSYAPVAH